MKRYFGFLFSTWCCVIVVFGLMTGCAAVKTTVSPPITVESKEGFQWPDNNLSDRFQQYWTLRKAGDAAGSFEMEAPHVREMVIRGRYDGFCNKARADWMLIRLEKINKITEQLLEVDFYIIVKNKDGGQKESFYRDSWLLLSGQWFHVLKDPFLTGDGLGK